MLFEFAIAFAIFALLKFFQGGVTRMLPPLLLAGMVHGPHLIGMVSSNEDKSVTGKNFVLSAINKYFFKGNVGFINVN